jgi:hypothetical protein
MIINIYHQKCMNKMVFRSLHVVRCSGLKPKIDAVPSEAYQQANPNGC